MITQPILGARSASTAWAGLRDRLSLHNLVLWAGLAALIIPTLLRLAELSWATEAGAHGPIVLATGLWLLWRDRAELAKGRVQPLLPGALVFMVLLPLYVVGRVTSILMLESIALYGIIVTVAHLRYGSAVLRRLWFPIFYGLFLITPPENWVFVATRPLKMALSVGAVDLLAWAGFSIGSSGTVIQIEGYQLLVATACSGINSLIGISAISLFYVYLIHGSAPRYALLLTLFVLPLAVLTNFLRVLILILVTYYLGEEVGKGLAHEAAGVLMFMLALALLLGLDAVLHPVAKRMGWTR